MTNQSSTPLPECHSLEVLDVESCQEGVFAAYAGAGGGHLPDQAAAGPDGRTGGRRFAAGALDGLRRGLRPFRRLPGRGGGFGPGLHGGGAGRYAVVAGTTTGLRAPHAGAAGNRGPASLKARTIAEQAPPPATHAAAGRQRGPHRRARKVFSLCSDSCKFVILYSVGGTTTWNPVPCGMVSLVRSTGLLVLWRNGCE